MVSVLNKELGYEVEKTQVQEVEDHSAEDQLPVGE